MSAFEDYCLVCEKLCNAGEAYCSDECKNSDLEVSVSPALSACSSVQMTNRPSVHLQSVISPLLTPQINPRKSIVGTIQSPQTRGMTYESPLLSGSIQNHHLLNDLDNNRLDLNVSVGSYKHANKLYVAATPTTSISERLSVSSVSTNEPKTQLFSNSNSNSSSKVSDVSTMLSNCPSENYKKWLSTH